MMRKKTVYAGSVVLMAAAILLLVPIGIIRDERISHNGGEVGRAMVLEEEMEIAQYFTPAYDYIKAISIDINRKNETVSEGRLHFALCDDMGEELFRREYNLSEVIDSSFFKIPVGRAVKAGKLYMWKVWVTETGDVKPELICTASGVISPPENGKMIVWYEESDSTALNMYTYGARQGKVAALNYIAFVLWAGISFAAYLSRKTDGKTREA